MVHPVAQHTTTRNQSMGLRLSHPKKKSQAFQGSAAKRTASQLQCNPNKPAKPGDPRKMAKQWCLSRDILGIQRKTFKSQPKSAQAIFYPGFQDYNPGKLQEAQEVASVQAVKRAASNCSIIWQPSQAWRPEESGQAAVLGWGHLGYPAKGFQKRTQVCSTPRETEPKQAIDPEWPSGCPRKVPHTAVGEVKSDLLLTEQSRVFYNTPSDCKTQRFPWPSVCPFGRTDLIVKVPDTDYVGAAYWNLKERERIPRQCHPCSPERAVQVTGQTKFQHSIWGPSSKLKNGFCSSLGTQPRTQPGTLHIQAKRVSWTTSTPDTQQPALGVERESVTARIAHDQVSRIQEEDVANWASIYKEYCNDAPDPSERNPLRVARIGASGSRIGGWGCVTRTRAEESDSGALQTGVPTGSKTKGCLRGAQANQSLYNPARELVDTPRQETESRGSGIAERKGSEGKTRTTRWGQEHSRLKSKNQAIQPKYGL
ncbi:hypothetical protein B0H14DRAFT_2562206 [Mycena olivaceomarginata]|nr:hypothetical protein B0H14DRAFT_2562206 [Mycena olivaceomarginata]